jgi:chitin disaccharide deacetylase
MRLRYLFRSVQEKLGKLGLIQDPDGAGIAAAWQAGWSLLPRAVSLKSLGWSAFEVQGRSRRATRMRATRLLLVTADDYGIGPETSRAIRELGSQGVVTSTVFLVNSPHAESDIDLWRRSGKPVEMGWHPCLTMDRPILPAEAVPSLVDAQGRFHSLGGLLTRLALGQIRQRELGAELSAQWDRFVALVGQPPLMVNGHKHIHIFPQVGSALRELLGKQSTPPYLRQLREPWSMLCRIPGARFKRVCLSLLGRWSASSQRAVGLPGNEILAGVTDPPWVKDAAFFARWLKQVPGDVVELMVHPGHHDDTLLGRDCTLRDGQMQRRVDEWSLLRDPAFLDHCRQAQFRLVTAEQWLRCRRGERHAA